MDVVTRWTTLSWGVAVAAASLSLVTACSIMWLAISRPDELARSLADGRVTPLVQALAVALVDALRSLASWL
jgi:hypothetical protein